MSYYVGLCHEQIQMDKLEVLRHMHHQVQNVD